MAKDDDHGLLAELAKRFKLNDDEAGDFISSGMKRLGYVPKVEWDEPAPENGGGDGGDFFTKRRQQNSGGNSGGGNGGQRQARGGDWQYGG